MSAPTVRQILTAIQTALNTVDNLRPSIGMPATVNVSGQASVAIVPVPPIVYRESMGRGTASLAQPYTVMVLTDTKDTELGQLKLADLASFSGSGSVIAAIEADPTLGGVVHQCVVWEFRPLGLEEINQINYFGGEFTLRVLFTGS